MPLISIEQCRHATAQSIGLPGCFHQILSQGAVQFAAAGEWQTVVQYITHQCLSEGIMPIQPGLRQNNQARHRQGAQMIGQCHRIQIRQQGARLTDPKLFANDRPHPGNFALGFGQRFQFGQHQLL